MHHGCYRIRKIIVTLMITAVMMGTACGKEASAPGNVSSVTSAEITSAASTEKIVAERTIAVEDLEGTVKATAEGSTVDVVKGEHLKSGQEVETGEESSMELLLDSDMHVSVWDNTKFVLVAEGSGKSTKTRIELEEGMVESVIDRKLEDGETYEVSTFNAVMSVRGTDFNVSVNINEGKKYTVVFVYEGVVEVTTTEEGGKTFEVGVGESVVMSELGVYRYSSNDLKAKLLSKKETVYYSPSDSWVTLIEYEYDEDGHPMMQRWYSNGEALKNVEIECDGDGNIIKEKHCGTDGTLYYTVEREFNSNGNITRETERSSDGSILTERLCSYDSDGKMREEAMPEYPEEMTLPWHSTYMYDGSGLLTAVVTDFEGGSYRYDWKYDSAGRITEKTYNYDPLSGTCDERTYNYQYDDRGNVLGYDVSSSVNWDGYTDLRYTMEYDENGNLIKETIFDVAGNTPYKITEYEYSE